MIEHDWDTLPRHLSAWPDFPHYREDWEIWGHRIEVLLNGAVQKGVLAFDMDEGWIMREELHGDGNPAIRRFDRAKGAISYERVTGAVEVRWADVGKVG